jgi:PPE-repeat protein
MDFGAFPPEINSARIYAGPGSAPMIAAASAWDGLAAELRAAAAVYQAVIVRLTGEEWMGPASGAMAAAAAPYATWMSTTAEQAEQTAVQAKAAAAAFQEVFAMTVPPPVVAANRAQLAALVASNVLGQNTPAIAATEAYYGQMWAQDAGAMYGYAANSAAAAKVTPFVPPRQNTNPAGQDSQAGLANQAAGTSSGSGVQSTLSQAVSTTPNQLQGLASPLSSGSSGSMPSTPPSTPTPPTPAGLSDGDLANGMTNLMSSSMSPMGVAGITQVAADSAVIGAITSGGLLDSGIEGGMAGLSSAPAGLISAPASLASTPATLAGSGAVSAGLGQATPIGALSVPASWTSAAPVATPPATASTSLVSSWSAAAPNAGPGGTPGMPGMPMAGSGAGRGYGFAAPRYGFKPTVMARPVIAG